jgi:LmbE family N-acetylglucosaminyl deacetylase
VLESQEVHRALAVVGHPDDAEFWAGGTVALWTDAGIDVSYCVLTNGDAGGFDPSVPRSEIPAIRQAEQRAAADVLGVRDVRFFSLQEDALVPTAGLRRELVRLIRELRPERVLTWSPEWNWHRFRSSHPNHRATGEITLAAVYPDAGNPFAHRALQGEGLDAWQVSEIWLLNSREPNHYVDITDTFDRKVAAVGAHASQIAEREHLADELRDRIAVNTAAANLPEGRLAEAFQVVMNR